MSTTLNSSSTNAPPHSAALPEPKTPAEYQALALEDAKNMGW
jgi:hypothetical protein